VRIAIIWRSAFKTRLLVRPAVPSGDWSGSLIVSKVRANVTRFTIGPADFALE